MGSVNYIFANTGQVARLVVQVLDGNGHPVDLDGYANWLDGYGYLIDGYWSDPPDGYYPDGYSDGYAGPTDGYFVPVVKQIVLPDLSSAPNYPRPMMRIGVGLYVHGFRIPTGVPAIGTYIASVSWTEKEVSQSNSVGFGYSTLVDGYVLVTPPGGIPAGAVIVFSRETVIGQIGEVTIVPGSQTTTQFAFSSTSSYDESVIVWTWNSLAGSSTKYVFRWETYSINAARPFGITSVTPV